MSAPLPLVSSLLEKTYIRRGRNFPAQQSLRWNTLLVQTKSDNVGFRELLLLEIVGGTAVVSLRNEKMRSSSRVTRNMDEAETIFSCITSERENMRRTRREEDGQ